MPRAKTAEEAYDYGIAEGHLRPLAQVNKEKVRSLLANAETFESSGRLLAKSLDNKAKEWLAVYANSYDALRILAEALLLLEGMDATNHQCLFAAIVLKYPGLELDWDFFEKVRTKRNGFDYYGNAVTYKDWKEIELQLGVYASTMKKEIQNRL